MPIKLLRNKQREEIIYQRWLKGMTIRATSEETAIPEGTVAYYYKKFNKNPEKFSSSNQSESKDSDKKYSIAGEIAGAISARDTYQTYNRLIKEEKYHEAKEYIESILLLNKLTDQFSAGSKRPEIFGPILLDIKPEQGEDSLTYVTRVQSIMRSLLPLNK